MAVLPKKKGLTLLNLRENELEDLGALFLAKAISSLQGLRKLDLTQNQVPPPSPFTPHLFPQTIVLMADQDRFCDNEGM